MIIPYAYTLTSILVQEKFQANVDEEEAEAEAEAEAEEEVEEIEEGGGRGEEEEAANHIHKENIVELPTLLIPIVPGLVLT
jgi:hypothetical protein